MNATAAAQSDVGLQRESNEDCFAIDTERGLFVAADGMGGHAAGKLASELGTRSFVRAMPEGLAGNAAAAMELAALGNHPIQAEALRDRLAARPELARTGSQASPVPSPGAKPVVNA